MNAELKKRVVSLIRVSTEEQAKEERAGIPRQENAIKKAVKTHSLKVVEHIEITDVSGSNVANSPQFQAMMAKIKSKEVDGVVVAELSRLARPECLGDLWILDAFQTAKAVIYTETTAHNFQSNESTLLTQIISVLAGHERRSIIKMNMDAKEAKRKQGKCPSAAITLPRGVAFVRGTGPNRGGGEWIYTPDVMAVQEAFRMIDEEGNTNLSNVGQRVGIGHRTLRNLLSNPIYIGWRIYDKKRGDEKYESEDGKQADRRKVARNEHEIVRVKVFNAPAVDPDRFERVQALLAQKTAKWRGQREVVEVNLGTGVAACAHCGSRLYASSSRRKTTKRPGYYICACNYYLAKRQGKSCVQQSIRKEHLDDTLIAFAAKHLANPKNIAMLAEKLETASEAGGAKDAENQLKELKKRRERLVDMAEQGVLEKNEIADRMKTIRDSIAAAERIVAEGGKLAIRGRHTDRYLKLLAKACVGFAQLTTKMEQRASLRAMFAKVSFRGPEITSFVPNIPLDAACTENGTRINAGISETQNGSAAARHARSKITVTVSPVHCLIASTSTSKHRRWNSRN